jgi:hypothetical protein
MIATSDVLATISRNTWTAVVLSADGQIAEVVPFTGELSADTFLEFTRKHVHGRRFRLVQQADLSEGQLKAILSEIREPLVGDAESSRRLAQSVEDFIPRYQPLAAARAIAEAIAKWFSK